MSTTTIIIVTYNAMPWIDRCIKSCENYPVIVVDNASTDATVAHIQASYPHVKLLPQNTNLGFGQGNNVGITYALNQGAEQVFLLNQDAYLVADCLKVLIKKQQEQPQYGILSPVHLNGKGDALDKNFGIFINYQKVPALLSDLILDTTQDMYDVPFVNAAGWLLSKHCLQTVGGFDPLFFHYAEDDNYCQRVLFHGFKIGVVLNIYLHHDREDRAIIPIEKYSNAYYQQLERRYKLFYADITKDSITIDADITQLKRTLCKHYIKLRFSNAHHTKKQLTLLASLRDKILKSRGINRQKGAHYLG